MADTLGATTISFFSLLRNLKIITIGMNFLSNSCNCENLSIVLEFFHDLRDQFHHLLIVVFFSFILSRLSYLAFSANLGLLCMPHPGMGPLV